MAIASFFYLYPLNSKSSGIILVVTHQHTINTTYQPLLIKGFIGISVDVLIKF